MNDDAEVDEEIDAIERGTEHLQTAAREMLSAARAFLDAVEDLVEDPDRIKELGHAVGTVAQQVARVGRSAMADGSDIAWFDREPDDGDADAESEGGGEDGEPLF